MQVFVIGGEPKVGESWEKTAESQSPSSRRRIGGQLSLSVVTCRVRPQSTAH
jgi:hypothetical protein